MKRLRRVSISLLTALVVLVMANSGCNDCGVIEAGAVDMNQAPQFLLMPKSLALQKPLWITDSITVRHGGRLTLKYVENDSTKPKEKLFELEIELKFAKRSVSDDFVAGLGLDAHYLMSNLALEFGPEGTSFLKPADLDIKIKGLDLSEYIKGEKIRLYYASEGKWEEMKGKVSANFEKGELSCKDGKLPHFSRYAFGRQY